MKRRYVRMKRFMGVSAIILSVLIAFFPTNSFAEATEDSGTDGEIAWSIASGTLTLSKAEGTDGRMRDYTTSEDSAGTPWQKSDAYASVKNIVVADGVASLGRYGLSTVHSVESVKIAGSVTTISEEVGWKCLVDTIEFESGVTTVEEKAFINTTAKTIRFPRTVTSVSPYAFVGQTNPYTSTIKDVYGYKNTGADKFVNDINKLLGETTGEGVQIVGTKVTFHDLEENTDKKDDSDSKEDTDKKDDSDSKEENDKKDDSSSKEETDKKEDPKTLVTDKRTSKTNTDLISFKVTKQNADVYLEVKDGADTNLKSQVTDKNDSLVQVFDLSLVDKDGKAVSDFESCEITVPISGTLPDKLKSVQMYTFDSSNKLEKLSATITSSGTAKVVKFTTTHFSEFGLVATADTTTTNTNTNTNTGNNNTNTTNNTNTGTTTNNTSNNSTNTGTNNTTNTTNNTNTGTTTNTTKPTTSTTTNTTTNNTTTNNTNTGTNNTATTNTGTTNTTTTTNANDMPKTGEGDGIRLLIALAVFLFGSVELVASIPKKIVI